MHRAGETEAKQENNVMHENTGHCENISTFQLWMWQDDEKKIDRETEWFSNEIKRNNDNVGTEYTIYSWIASNKSMNHEQNFVFHLTKMCA